MKLCFSCAAAFWLIKSGDLGMGVDHGGTGTSLPLEFGVGDANANVSHRILSYRYKKERSVAFKFIPHPTRHRPTFGGGALAMRPHRIPAKSTPMDWRSYQPTEILNVCICQCKLICPIMTLTLTFDLWRCKPFQ